mgnify:CR=1 FL=1
MEGATGIDLSPCQGMQMLNIDSEEEGQFVAACAGGIRDGVHITRTMGNRTYLLKILKYLFRFQIF